MHATLVRAAQAGDRNSIRTLVTAAFGSPREADLIDSLHAERAVLASFVAGQGETLAGHILFSRMFIVNSGASTPAVALAPLAVHPACQRQGVGSLLIRHGLNWLREHGESIVMVLGHPAYYPRFGFNQQAAGAIESPFRKESFMALELVPGSLRGVSGRVRYANAFRLDPDEGMSP